jgi:hypothetical protein
MLLLGFDCCGVDVGMEEEEEKEAREVEDVRQWYGE